MKELLERLEVLSKQWHGMDYGYGPSEYEQGKEIAYDCAAYDLDALIKEAKENWL